jgi:hypothetical protein
MWRRMGRRGVVTLVFAWLALLAGAVTAGAVMAAHLAAAPAPLPTRAGLVDQTLAPRLCRFGFDGLDNIAPFDVNSLRAGWYVNWRADLQPLRPGGIQYMPIISFRGPNREIRPSLSGAALAANVAANPGATWIIGNEPDRIDYQDGLLPAQYAQLYHDTYVQIKAVDASAQIAAGSIVQPSPLRLQYLDLVLAAYRAAYGTTMPVDVWNIHAFILNEQSCGGCWGADIPPGVNASEGLVLSIDDNGNFDIFKAFIVAFRQWMAARGYRDRPLIISEYGIQMPYPYLENFPPTRVNAYMSNTFAYLSTASDAAIGYPADGNRLVQRWAWYSLNDDPERYNGGLFSPIDAVRTTFGDNYAAYTASVAATVNLKAVSLWGSPPSLVAGAPLTLTLRLANTGDAGMSGPVTVRFYDGDPAQGGAQIGADQSVPALNGCAETTTAQVTWPNPPPGATRVWAVIDPSNVIAETNEADNMLSARILTVANAVTFLPRISYAP